MTATRRCFLGMVAAALGLKPAQIACNSDLSSDKRYWVSLKTDPLPDKRMVEALLPFSIWETVTLQPGQLGRVNMFPAPLPASFVISSIAQSVNASALYRDALSVYDNAVFALDFAETAMARTSLAFIGMGGRSSQLFPSFDVAARDEMRVALLLSDGKPLTISAPVDLTIVLGGAVKRWVPSRLFESDYAKRGGGAAA